MPLLMTDVAAGAQAADVPNQINYEQQVRRLNLESMGLEVQKRQEEFDRQKELSKNLAEIIGQNFGGEKPSDAVQDSKSIEQDAARSRTMYLQLAKAAFGSGDTAKGYEFMKELDSSTEKLAKAKKASIETEMKANELKGEIISGFIDNPTDLGWNMALMQAQHAGVLDARGLQALQQVPPEQRMAVAKQMQRSAILAKDQYGLAIKELDAKTKEKAVENKETDAIRKDVTKNREITLRHEDKQLDRESREKIAETQAESRVKAAKLSAEARVEAADKKVKESKTAEEAQKHRNKGIDTIRNPKTVKTYTESLKADHPEVTSPERAKMAEDMSRIEADLLDQNPDMDFATAHDLAKKAVDSGIEEKKGWFGSKKHYVGARKPQQAIPPSADIPRDSRITPKAEVDSDVQKKFNADPQMKGYKLGTKKTEAGVEVLDSKGNLVGYYK